MLKLRAMAHVADGVVIQLRRKRITVEGQEDRSELVMWCPACDREVPQAETTIPTGPLCVMQTEDL